MSAIASDTNRKDKENSVKKFCAKIAVSGLSSLLSLTIVGAASAQTLSQTPLEATIIAEPNIMLHLDDSLSMYNMIQDDAYDRNGTYTPWSFTFNRTLGSFFPDNIPYETINRGSCPSNYIQGTNGGTTRCLRLPDVVSNTSWARDSFYTNHYLQYLFDTYSSASSDVDLTSVISNEYRLTVLQDASKLLVASRSGIRWCVSDLKNSSATFITAPCGSNNATLETAIDSTSPPEGGGTPLAESFHEITEYFRGDGYTSPVQYRCQKNFAVMITDGYPTNDVGSTSDIDNETKADYNLSGSESLPNWDGLAPTTTVTDFNNNTVPQYSDGYFADPSASGLGQGNEGYTLYLDDLALFGQEIDMFRTGLDAAGEPYGDATDTAATGDFLQQNIQTYAIGFGIQNQMLEDTGEYGGGLEFSASNALELNTALNSILADVVDLIGSSASSTATTAFLSTGNQVFQVKYDTNDWTGSLISYSIDSDPNSATFGELGSPIWSTDTAFASDSAGDPPARNVLTVNTNTNLPVEMIWSNLSSTQQAQLDNDPAKLDYILGDQSEEVKNGGTRRNRSKLLGDVVHSQPVFVADQDYGYDDPSYQTFIESSLVTSREPIVYVGGNDGLMHGFNAAASSAGGSESFAFAPRSIYPLLGDFDQPAYLHHYFVDGRGIALDAQLSDGSTTDWATVLISSMGAGAKGLFALNITDPSQFSDIDSNADDIYLWEVNNSYPVVATSGSSVSNIAPAATVSQSSTAFSGAASRAIDNNTSGVYSNGSISHTGFDNEAWFDLDLADLSLISEIRIHNRTDACCSDRLADFSVFVSQEPFDSTSVTATQAQAGVTEYYFPGIAPALTNITVDNLAARYVRVQLHAGAQALSIAEIQIDGVNAEIPFEEMGNILDQPSLIRVGTSGDPTTHQWLVVTGNGVHSENGDARFYAIDLNDGSKVADIVLDDTGNNGIVSNTAVDIDGDDLVDRVYLSDLKGNVWRLDWDDSTDSFVSEYTSGSNPEPFFTAGETTSGDIQPITSAVEVTRFPGESGSLMIHFGTGKFYDDADNQVLSTGELVRSFYGVVDRGNSSGTAYTALTKGDLQIKTIATTSGLRTVSDNAVDYSTQFGWYMDLPVDGERVVYESIAIKDRILFTTLIPTDPAIVDPCVPSVAGWLMEVDAINGSSPDSVVFDANNDGDFDDSDAVVLAGNTVQVAGIQPSSGAPLPPSIIRVEGGGSGSTGASGTLKGIVSDSRGELTEFVHQAPRSRTSWRRLN